MSGKQPTRTGKCRHKVPWERGGGIGSGERVSCRREEREEHIDFILLEKIRKNKGHRMKTRKIRKLRNTI